MKIGDECPDCKETNHTGVWSEKYKRFMVCAVCGDRGVLDVFGIDILSGLLTSRALDEVPECDCNSAFGYHEAGCAISIYYVALRQ